MQYDAYIRILLYSEDPNIEPVMLRHGIDSVCKCSQCRRFLRSIEENVIMYAHIDDCKIDQNMLWIKTSILQNNPRILNMQSIEHINLHMGYSEDGWTCTNVLYNTNISNWVRYLTQY